MASGSVQVTRRRSIEQAQEDQDVELLFDQAVDVPSELFEHERLGRDVQADLSEVRSLLGLIQDHGVEEDAKLRRLEAYLEGRRPASHPTLVFTQFAETAAYLGEALGQRFGRTATVSGSQGGVLQAARRFAPVANRFAVDDKDRLELLITTDVLSEGVNLQDADTLVNYDLHWNPVRLIQRAGRIDRIGTEHEEIHVASFLPERELETDLGLEEVLRRRIREFIQVFGEDSAVLPGGDVPDEGEMRRAYTGTALDSDSDGEELDGLSRHADRLLQLRRQSPDDFARVLAIRLGRRTATTATETDLVVTRLGWLWTFWNASQDGLDEMDTLAGMDTLYRHSLAERREVDLDEGHRQLASMRAASDRFSAIATTFRAQHRLPRLNPSLLFVVSHLEDYQRRCIESQRELVLRLINWVRQGHAQEVLTRRAKTWRKEQWTPEMVFSECRGIFAHVPPKVDELGEARLVVGAFGSTR